MLYEAFNGRDTTTAYYSGIADVSSEAARIDLRTLVATRLMRAQGQARARRYAAGPLLEPPAERLVSRPAINSF